MRPSKDAKLKIANLALSKIGARAITSFDQSGSNEAAAINAVYTDILEEVLSEHPWSFAQKRIALSYSVPDDVSRSIQGRIYPPVSISAATKADPCVITAANHGLSNGDRILISGVVGMTQLNGNYYVVADVTTNTFSLTDDDDSDEVNSTSYTTYVSGGQIFLADFQETTPLLITGATVANPVVVTAANHGLVDGDWIYIQGVLGMTELNGNFYIVDGATTNTINLQDTDAADINGLLYTPYTAGGQILETPEYPSTDTGTVVVYQKPLDYVKIIKKSDSGALLNVEQDKLISNSEALKIKYTFLNTDVTTYYPKFTQALASRLAAEICFRITNSTTKAKELLSYYHDTALPMAISSDSTQDTPEQPMQDEWLDSMINGKVVANPETWHFL